MNRNVALVLFLALSIAPPVSTTAQTPSAQQTADDRIVVGTNEVMIDAVVRDKKGRPVKDLQVSDFQIIEDGVPQEIKSFRLVGGEAAAAASEAKPTGTPKKAFRKVMEDFNAGRIGAVALVFDRLSQESCNRARAAALSYIGDGLSANDFVGVFGIDLRLSVFQTFTNNDQLVKQALDRVGSANSSSYSSSTAQITDLSEKNLALTSQLSQAESSAGEATAATAASAIGALAVQTTLNTMALRAAEGFERLEQTQQGQTTTDGLLSIISAMGSMTGRKAVIFFSEGVAIPTAVASNFRTVISNANRANVSIYAVDAAGLRAASNQAEAGRALSALGQQRANQAGSANDAFGSMMRDSERNEELVRHTPDSSLGQLANETGGLLVSNTNNPGARLRQVNEDLHTYYVLTYSPKNQNYDGRFRQINVKVNSSGAEVQTRKGYYGLPATYDSPVLAFEAPALAILGGKSPPSAFASKAGTFSFPEASKPGLVPVMVQTSLGAINFVTDAEKKTYRTDFTIVVLVKDMSQHAVTKLSNRYMLSGPLEQLETAKRGNILFYRETELEPGEYTVDSIVYDATNNQSSISHASVDVPGAERTKLRLSSIVIVGRAQKTAAAEKQPVNPFQVGELLLVPNMGEALHKAGSKGLSLFVTIYPATGSTAVPKMTIELYQSGRPLGQLPVELPAPDPSGRIQYTGTIPIDAFPLGEYELKATVSDGVTKAIRSARLTVQP
jgi:VWFA-related protein